MSDINRAFLPSFAELIDRLSVDQIKEFLLPHCKEAVVSEMVNISHDIDVLIDQRGTRLTARLIRMFIALAQINLHIWMLKEKMKEFPAKYNEYLKLAHQLNGTRNQLKNLLLDDLKDSEPSAKRTNFDTDGLEGWQINI
jgi:hypothetical protein